MIAKAIETSGIPTVCLSSALSITQSIRPPRSVFIDYPLGHTAGKAHDPADQKLIMQKTLSALIEIKTPGEIVDLGQRWAKNDDWKNSVMRPSTNVVGNKADDRVERFDTPQYQTPEDADLADVNCPTCVFVEDSKLGI